MANKIDSELTAAVTDPSSDVDSSGASSSVGESKEKDGVDSSGGSSSVVESEEKDVKTTQIQKALKPGATLHLSLKRWRKRNDHKSEKSKEGVDSSGASSSVVESEEKDVKTTQIQKSPQTGSDPPPVPETLEEENDHKSEKSKEGVDSSGASSSVVESEEKDESLLQSQRPARDINESGDGFNQKDEANAETGENEDQVQDADAKQGPESSWKGDSEDDGTTTRRRKTESPQQTASSEPPQERQSQISVGSNNKPLWIVPVVVFVLVIFYFFNLFYFSASTPSVPEKFNVVDVFNQEMEKLKTSFPNQRPDLWKRSLIHLRRHLKTEHPTEPVSLILTSGNRAEKTLGCLARCLAQAFSTARNSSVLNINGKSKSKQDSDQVKLDIDIELKNAFEGKRFAAVIHRFEELPPGSTLIFYRYCDHENAAYKNVFLAFTVMLDAEVEVPSNISLGRVEEMVQEHVKQKFVSNDKLANFNQMDVDKLSGLWSRISHLILPVAAEEKIEHQGCGDCDKSF